MQKPSGDEVITQKHIRFFIQPGGPHPNNQVIYAGVQNAYFNIENIEAPVRGGISPINVHDPRRIGQYRQVGNSIEAPEFATFTVQFLQLHGALPRHLITGPDCETNFYKVAGRCKDPSDFLNGWESYVSVASKALQMNSTEAGGAFDSDDMLQDEVEYTAIGGKHNVGKLGFSEKGATQVYSEIIDVTFGNRVQCGNCGPSDNGTKLAYAVARNTVASPGQAPSIFYSVDTTVTWTEQSITGAVSTDVPTAIDVVGQYVVVVFDNGTTGGYFYSAINAITGIPSSTWTKVTTGFVSGAAPQDIYVASASEIWFCAKAGYIYLSTSIQSGVSVKDNGSTTANQLNRIHGVSEVIVAVGNSGTVIYSLTKGETFSVVTNAPSANTLQAVLVMGPYLWWTGDSSGDVFWTDTQGLTAWTEKVIDSGFTSIYDLVAANHEVLYVAAIKSGPVGYVYSSWNGGYSWSGSSPRILNTPTYDRPNRIAVPDVPNQGVANNNLLVGGLAGNGSDGILLYATAALL